MLCPVVISVLVISLVGVWGWKPSLPLSVPGAESAQDTILLTSLGEVSTRVQDVLEVAITLPLPTCSHLLS